MHFEQEAHDFLKDAQADNPLVVVLRGDLGAGKTTFVKAALSALGYAAEQVQSPTFLKLLEYAVPNYGLCIHIDAYRMSEANDFDKLALESYAESARTWFVEWPELFLKHLAERANLRKHLGFSHYWELELDLKKVGPILGPGGRGGEGQSAARRGIRWRRKSF